MKPLISAALSVAVVTYGAVAAFNPLVTGGNYLLMDSLDSNSMSSVASNYYPISGEQRTNGTETNRLGYVPPGTLSKLYCRVASAPGSGKSWTVTVRVGLSNSALTCSIADAATSCADDTHVATVTTDPRVTYQWAPTSGPALDQVSCHVYYIPA